MYSASSPENPGGMIVGILDLSLNAMKKEQVCEKAENQIKGC